MQKTESVGSVNSLSIGVSILEPRSKKQIEAENDRLRQLLHERVGLMSVQSQEKLRIELDAKRWRFAKARYAKQLGFDTPAQLQDQLDVEMFAAMKQCDQKTRPQDAGHIFGVTGRDAANE